MLTREDKALLRLRIVQTDQKAQAFKEKLHDQKRRTITSQNVEYNQEVQNVHTLDDVDRMVHNLLTQIELAVADAEFHTWHTQISSTCSDLEKRIDNLLPEDKS